MYHVVNSEQLYNIGNDTMVVEYISGLSYIVNGMIGFDFVRFHAFLQTLVDNRLF